MMHGKNKNDVHKNEKRKFYYQMFHRFLGCIISLKNQIEKLRYRNYLKHSRSGRYEMFPKEEVL